MSYNLGEHLSEPAVKNVEQWLTHDKYQEYKAELKEMIDQQRWQEIEDAFFKVIEFGTAGRRGTTGIGTNRINRVTIGESTQALCDYAREANVNAATMGIVIACDTRLTSPELSKYAASVCAANGFTTYIFDYFRATPELSFAVRHLGAVAGIVISASHNPPADNGFKVCWTDGGQLVSPHDKGVLEKAQSDTVIKVTDFDDAVKDGSIQVIGDEVDAAYIAAVVGQAEGSQRDVKIVYSPLHGAGQTNVLPALRAAGFTNISVVEDQMVPDGNFPTIENGKPNPEEPLANDRAVAQLMAEDADIAITNDPDADRIGVMVRQGERPIYLSGNQSAVLAADYALMKLQERGDVTSKHYLAKTIVTTEMLTAVAKKYDVSIYSNMLIGFKYIGKLLLDKENTDEIFVLGAEESFGLLKGSYARDKDGATGALPLAEYAAELKCAGKTLYDRLLELYAEHGLYLERLDNAYFTGASGFAKMQNVMNELRKNPPAHIEGRAVTAIQDYDRLIRRELETGKESPINCTNGNVLVFEFENDPRKRITIRPSGTEPKLKFYVQWYEDASDDIESQIRILSEQLESISKTLEGIVLD